MHPPRALTLLYLHASSCRNHGNFCTLFHELSEAPGPTHHAGYRIGEVILLPHPAFVTGCAMGECSFSSGHNWEPKLLWRLILFFFLHVLVIYTVNMGCSISPVRGALNAVKLRFPLGCKVTPYSRSCNKLGLSLEHFSILTCLPMSSYLNTLGFIAKTLGSYFDTYWAIPTHPSCSPIGLLNHSKCTLTYFQKCVSMCCLLVAAEQSLNNKSTVSSMTMIDREIVCSETD